jgi:hypothetical protein
VVPYLALSVLMYLSLQVSYLLVLALAVPTAGFLVRVFVMFHDCAHGSLLPSKRANAWLGAILGLLVFAPFLCWKHDHAVHHATSGDLDRRGTGDVRTLTVSEYQALSRRGRMGYRAFRDVRAGADRCDGDRATDRPARGTPTHAAQRARHGLGPRPAVWWDRLVDRLARTPVG